MADEISEKLRDYSTKTNVNGMNIELLKQSAAVADKRMEEYQQRLHAAEDTLLVLKTIQAIHDVQIQGFKKILTGNGERETIPMDIDRLERMIQEVLKVDWRSMQAHQEDLLAWREKIDARAWQIWLVIVTLIITNVLSFLK